MFTTLGPAGFVDGKSPTVFFKIDSILPDSIICLAALKICSRRNNTLEPMFLEQLEFAYMSKKTLKGECFRSITEEG